MDPISNPDEPRPPTDGEDSAQEILGGFPRHLTRQLIEDEGHSSTRRQRLAGWLFAAGLVVLALSYPQEALVGRGPGLLASWSEGSLPGPAFAEYWLVQAVMSASGLRLEPAAFVLSALCYGACLPLMMNLGRRVGLSVVSSMVVTLIVLLSPAAWIAGTTPGPEALGLLCALALLHILWCARESGFDAGTRLLAVLLFAVAISASPTIAGTWPAVALALSPDRADPTRGRTGWALLYGALLATTAALAYISLGTALLVGDEGAGVESVGEFGHAAVLAMQADSTWLNALQSTLLLLPALGIALLGLASLALQKRGESEARAPLWLGLWAVVPLALFITPGSPRELPGLYLLPLAALGGFDFVARRADDLELRWLCAPILVVVATLLGVLAHTRTNDPLREWRDHTRAVLDPGDIVVVHDREHAYLLHERWALEVVRLSDFMGQDLLEAELTETLRDAGGRRIVVDAPLELTPSLVRNLPRLEGLEEGSGAR